MVVDADVVLNDAQLLNAISGNNGSFRGVMFAIKRLILSAKRNQQAAPLPHSASCKLLRSSHHVSQ